MTSSTPTNSNPAGYINPKRPAQHEQRIRWSSHNDIKLLLFGHLREITPSEHATIAQSFPGEHDDQTLGLP